MDLGRGVDGKRRRKYGYAESQAAAVDLLRTLGGRTVGGRLLATSTPTVGSYLEDWFATGADTWRASTRRGYRHAIALPQVCLDGLRAHRTKQLEERLKAGADWVETGLVFTTFARRGMGRKVGRGLQPRNVLRTLHALLETAKLPRVRFHDLRHSAASLLIAAGVELVEVSMLLGHSELRVTADLYSHLQKQTAAKAARHMDKLLKINECGN